MRKVIPFLFVLLVLISCLTACTFTQSRAGLLAGDAESASLAEEMMAAMAEGCKSDAIALMYPELAVEAEDKILQMIDYLDGRHVDAMEQKSINVNTSTGTSGKARQEQVVYEVTLDDGDVIFINTVYLSDSDGEGFISFQLVLGIV